MRLLFIYFLSRLSLFTAISTWCDVYPTDTIPELVAKCRGKDMISTPYEERGKSISLKGISQDDFDAIFSSKDTIQGPFHFIDSPMTAMIFPSAESFSFSKGKAVFSHNAHLKIISFPKMYELSGGQFEISHNPLLEQLDLAHVTGLMPKIFLLEHNPVVRSINMPDMFYSRLNEFIIIDNPLLEIITIDFTPQHNHHFKNRTAMFIDKKLTIRNNPLLKEMTIILPGKYSMTLAGMEIVNNRALVELPTNFKNDKVGMKIRGNPQLRREILERLRAKANDSDIQEYGECLFQEPVTELSAMDVCVYVYGNLILAGGGRTVTRLTRIEGDVSTGRVAIDSLDFLLDTDIYGKFESDLCDFDYSLFKSSKKGVKKRCQTTTGGKKSTRATTTTREATTEKEITGKTTTEGRTEGETRMTRAKETTERREESTEEAKEPSTAGGRDETTTGETERSTVTMGSEQLEQATRRKEEEKSSFPLIPVLAGIFLLLLVIIIAAPIFYYRNKKKKAEETEKSTKSENDQSASQISRRKE